MSRALVIYESMFGNTREVASAVAEGLADRFEVQLVEVSEAPDEIGEDIALLVLGAPTHAHGLSTEQSRAEAAKNKTITQPIVSQGPGLREWLDRARIQGPVVAVFDTRIQGPKLLWGSAAHTAEKRLRAMGCTPIASPESFLLRGPFGPVEDVLLDGERERALAWGRSLGLL